MTEIETHVETALSRLTESLRGKPKTEGLVKALAGYAQTVESALQGLYDGTRIDTAEGVALDALGAIVGQAREGVSDAIYRLRIKARVAVTRSRARASDLVRVVRALEPLATVEIEEFFPASLHVTIAGVAVDAPTLAIYAAFIRAARGAGIGALLLGSPFGAEEIFTLAPLTTLVVSVPAGGFGARFVVESTEGFPESGTLRASAYEGNEEFLTYGSKTATSFEQVESPSNDHDAGVQIGLKSFSGRAFDNGHFIGSEIA